MYRVFPALRADMNEGWVWLGRKNSEPRPVVRITNKTNGKRIYCECLEIDNNYLSEYNQPSRYRIQETAINSVVTMNDWYRKKLGNLEKNREYELEIEEYNTAFGKLCACLGHPQTIVRVATKLGLWSVALGVIGIIGAVFSIVPCVKQ
jgi:hypothetical protein